MSVSANLNKSSDIIYHWSCRWGLEVRMRSCGRNRSFSSEVKARGMVSVGVRPEDTIIKGCYAELNEGGQELTGRISAALQAPRWISNLAIDPEYVLYKIYTKMYELPKTRGCPQGNMWVPSRGSSLPTGRVPATQTWLRASSRDQVPAKNLVNRCV